MGTHGVRIPHMIHFTSDYAYAFIASTGSGDVSVIRSADRQVVAVLKTGPATHMAVVKADDSVAIADVIGDPNDPRSGKLVAIKIDKQRDEFTLGRSLTIAEDPLIKKTADKFSATRAICHEYSADGRLAYVTLGPGLKDGGLVVLDTEKFELVAAFPVSEMRSMRHRGAARPEAHHRQWWRSRRRRLVRAGDRDPQGREAGGKPWLRCARHLGHARTVARSG